MAYPINRQDFSKKAPLRAHEADGGGIKTPAPLPPPAFVDLLVLIHRRARGVQANPNPEVPSSDSDQLPATQD